MDKETAEGPDAKTKAVGTGPFTFQSSGSRATTSRYGKNKNYWQSGQPYLDGITLSICQGPAGDGRSVRGRRR